MSYAYDSLELEDAPEDMGGAACASPHPAVPLRGASRRMLRGLGLSAGIVLSVSFLGAAKVRSASREAKPPAVPAVPAAIPKRATAAPRPVSIQLRVLSSVTSESAQGESPAVSVSVMQHPDARQAAYHPGGAGGAELMKGVKATGGTLATVSALARAPRRVATLRMEVTAYCPCTKCCGPLAQGITASGLLVSHDRGRFVAADTGILRFGTLLEIPGYHDARPVEVIDRGGAIKGYKLDVYFPTHEEALLWGRKMLDVNVVE